MDVRDTRLNTADGVTAERARVGARDTHEVVIVGRVDRLDLRVGGLRAREGRGARELPTEGEPEL